jgi:hypothetical protein
VAQLSHNSSACKRPQDSSAHSSHTAPKRELHTSQQTSNRHKTPDAHVQHAGTKRHHGIRFPSHGMSNEVMECLIHVTPRSLMWSAPERHGIRFPNHGMCNEVTECVIHEISKLTRASWNPVYVSGNV